MIVRLAEVIRQMGAQVQQQVAGHIPMARDRERVRLLQVGRREATEGGLQLRFRRGQCRRQRDAWQTPGAELLRPVAHVTDATQRCADEVAEISGHMKGQSASRVRQSG